MRADRIPTKEQSVADVTAVSFAPFPVAWHTFWHSLTRRLFERSSADINTFERLTQLRFESLCARNIGNPPAHADGITAEEKAEAARFANETFTLKPRTFFA